MNTKIGRAVFTTKDGSVIMNRLSDPDYWDDEAFMLHSLNIDAREKGVKLINYTIDKEAKIISAVVDWL